MVGNYYGKLELNFFPADNAHNLATFNRTDPNLTSITQQNVRGGVFQGAHLIPIIFNEFLKKTCRFMCHGHRGSKYIKKA